MIVSDSKIIDWVLSCIWKNNNIGIDINVSRIIHFWMFMMTELERLEQEILFRMMDNDINFNEFKYVAIDNDGEIRFCKNRPEYGLVSWYCDDYNNNPENTYVYINLNNYNLSWKETLIRF